MFLVENLKSIILTSDKDGKLFEEKLEEWSPTKGNWTICWRATRHGWSSSDFHSRCDDKVPTLTIVKVVKNNTNLIFGGYANSSWNGSK